MENTPKVEEIRKIVKKLTGKKEEIVKTCAEVSDKEKLKESLKPYVSALTNCEIEKLCSFFASGSEFSDEKLATVAGGKEESNPDLPIVIEADKTVNPPIYPPSITKKFIFIKLIFLHALILLIYIPKYTTC